MLLNPFVIILVMYGLVMCGALALLVWAFNGRFDLSGRLFLLSEILRLPVIALIAVAHINPEYRNAITHFVISGSYLFSETAFVLSLYALSRGHGFKKPILVCGSILVLCAATEVARLYSASLPFLIHSILSGMICLIAVFICNSSAHRDYQETSFWRVLKYIESTFILIALIRVLLFFYREGFAPMQGTTQNLVILVSILSLLIFRYIAYLSIWMTSIPPNAQENILNRNFLRSLRERNQLLQKLSASNRRIGVSALASSVAHQLSQPLTGAALQAESVKRDLINERGKVENIEALDHISVQLKKMASLVLNLRGLFSEAQNPFEPFELVPICNEIIEIVTSSKSAKNVTFEKNYDDNPMVFGDSIQVQQVLINILDNALQAINDKANPMVKIGISSNDGYAILAVEDNGDGIDQNNLQRLFELYQTTRHDGIGIGLWLCKTIVEQHSGKIFGINAPSGGARFIVELPLFREKL